ncbi:hypothetical protein [uncultured Roseobacter sp.]|uniref:hypothetical protein n=1 Tax=uncultured Roseobacter sp. TaxID=114847 RepID=UPI00260357B5|nr:hypothetical protein [uncultured Roseobacter sp.]
MPDTASIRLIDPPEDAGRTTASLFASLASRLITLHYTSGVSVIGSTLAGLAEAGREISKTAEGARIRRALEASAIKENGDLLWNALRVTGWTEGMPAAPVLDHIRNDLALLLADDLAETIENVPAPLENKVRQSGNVPANINFIDTLMGLWIHSREIVQSVEAMARLAPDIDAVEPGDAVHSGPILR